MMCTLINKLTWKCKNLIFLCDELQVAWCPRSSSRVNQDSLSQTMKLTQIVTAHVLVLIWNFPSANYLRSWTYKLSEWCTRRKILSPEISVPFLSISFLLLLLPSPISVREPDPCKCKIIEFLIQVFQTQKWTFRNLHSTMWELIFH